MLGRGTPHRHLDRRPAGRLPHPRREARGPRGEGLSVRGEGGDRLTGAGGPGDHDLETRPAHHRSHSSEAPRRFPAGRQEAEVEAASGAHPHRRRPRSFGGGPPPGGDPLDVLAEEVESLPLRGPARLHHRRLESREL